MASTLSLAAAKCRVNMNDYSEKDEYTCLKIPSNRPVCFTTAMPKKAQPIQEADK
jgi:hypothetical protein